MNFNQKLIDRMRVASKSWRVAQTSTMPGLDSLKTDQLQKLTAVTELIQRTLSEALPGMTRVDSHAGLHSASLYSASPEQSLHDVNPRPVKHLDKKSKSDVLFSPHIIDAYAAESEEKNVGRFISGSYTNAQGKRGYKLYIPSCYTGQALPLIVMLHGCTQGPDDFATGTGMNLIAEKQECIVVYPVQEQSANSSKCWNWFKAIDQKRDHGEPALIAGITREIISNYHVDKSRVFIAGMSAGGAMAAIMADAYPELYVAVGIHSGLPFGAASDLPSALNAMRGAAGKYGKPSEGVAVPIIVFHGDQDHTVNSKNADHIMARYLDSSHPDKPLAQKENGSGKHGRSYTLTRYGANEILQQNGKKQVSAEKWIVHGAGHAWSGGNSQGSYTDAAGPDASREMLRFFFSQVPQAVPASSLASAMKG